ncbi:exodeoxyribonuclease VII large subunit [Plebeiibacterium marinum]|uniref:Exodeoxyribonuclease 7 large subunit n=1 Tax=Plebeiibacterium marinum TaxID=2992111 RepID=A0AAE3SKE6_9BACT|nr:exodeoxyribonuclease VII large subunit [Plebeiobacterium marinum]MCW3805420.1 exodeoxyribonuclease VII large subunit [Plebeiobacterium marinum]
MNESSLSLFQLNSMIKKKVHEAFAETYWVVAEISEIREVRNGHCYLELIEKDEKTEQIIAKCRANIWAYTYRMLKPYFFQATGQNLTSGIKVLLRASIDFQEVYGFSLNIRDIDPNYTLGDMAQKKQAILNKLSEEGVIDMNKELEVPLVPQKIAVISSPTAAGYEDFCNQLNNNSFGYKFYIKLFSAIMQGEQTEASVTAALDRIYEYEDFFDLVVIIRGGGSTSDLMCFDNYWIAYNIAQFPLPVFSGIGHERDETVVDYVAHTRLKTPTAVAEHILELVSSFDDQLHFLKDNVVSSTREILSGYKLLFERSSNRFKPLVNNSIIHRKSELNRFAHKLSSLSNTYINSKLTHISLVSEKIKSGSLGKIARERIELKQIPHQLSSDLKLFLSGKKSQLNLMEKTNKLVDPHNILSKGYSITYINGKAVKDSSMLKKGDTITTQFNTGSIDSTVN